ncbi:MAG TPA: hypothetical protein VGX91_03870, partial [Candidatus Cybelea sp.]|nr:hypothetical protein [Candidatus Cybelea sp.]
MVVNKDVNDAVARPDDPKFSGRWCRAQPERSSDREQLEFPHGGRALRMDARQDRVTVPGVGAVKLRKGRVVPVGWGRAWVRHNVGYWYACFECEREV